MQSNWLNIHVVGSKPLERAKNQALAAGVTGSIIGWAFFFGVPYWNTPYLLILCTLVTAFTILLYGLYELPFDSQPASRVFRSLQQPVKTYFPPIFAIISFLIFWILFLLFRHMMQGRGIPDTLWFNLSFYVGVPIMGIRRVMGKLYDSDPSRRMQILLEIIRLMGLFAGISLAMSYINGALFSKPHPGQSKINIGYILLWTPAVLTGLAGTVMFFDSVLGISERRKR